jgi:hypothetical protein
VENISHKDIFKDYYFNNKGILFKTFEININTFHYNYDIYWGDPNIIFDKKTLTETFPLAVTIMPHRYNYPNSRIFLHEKLGKDNNNVFELVIMHEIGHLWLHDIIGFNNPSSNNTMRENESELWADYFACNFFLKYRNTNNIEEIYKIFKDANNLQNKIYNLEPNKNMKYTNTKIENLKLLEKECLESKNEIIIHMINAKEITLNNLGDIFK